MHSGHINRMIGKVHGGYKIVKHLGSGGNADVFEVIDGKQQSFAMKLLIVNKGRYFTKKYSRFKDEIHVVKENQEHIQGIIPIEDIYLPENPTATDRPWYTMPIAKPLSKLSEKLESIEEVITCINELSKVLNCLHEKDIVHRDIKPSNIYFYKNAWVFGDFGLVDYPEKTELTEVGESVGPRNTIAPEMKRDAINADGKPADIYSLAKTLWILLTKVNNGFDGQYSHKISAFNLDNIIKPTNSRRYFTVTLHKLLELCTSNVPSERPSIEEFNRILNEWFELNQNYKKANILEWEFYLREIIQNTLPEKISWTNIEDIISILKLISRTNLNHTFFPSGGGMDLNNCTVSNQDGFIELQVGYILKLKPKRLTLNTFKASFDWNYFHLETEQIEPPVKVDRIMERERFDVELIETTPGAYSLIDDTNSVQGRRIALQFSGGIVIFSKGSYYNSIPSTYDGRHAKRSPEEFRNYIQQTINQINFDKENPEIAQARMLERIQVQEAKNNLKREVYKAKIQRFNEIWERKIQDVTIPISIGNSTNSKMAYYLTVHSNVNDKYYYISKEHQLIHYATSRSEANLDETSYVENFLPFYDFNELMQCVNCLEEHLQELADNPIDIPLMLNFDVSFYRLRKPTNMFSKEDLLTLIKTACHDELVCIDFEGNIYLNKRSDHSRLQRSQYPVISLQGDIENIHSKPNKFELLYLSLLSAWKCHLEANKSETITDTGLEHYDVNDFVEHELLAAILVAVDKYLD